MLNIPFLDVSVSLTNDGSISTDLYTKPTDKHQHLLYSSCHPLHAKKAIPFSLALRLRRICSTGATFNTRAAQLTTYLLKRSYNRNFVTKQIRRASDIQPLTLSYTIWQKRYPFYILFIEKRYPFHIPIYGSLVLVFMWCLLMNFYNLRWRLFEKL